MLKSEKKVIDNILNIGLVVTSIATLPINIANYFVLSASEYQLLRLFSPVISIAIIVFTFFRKRISVKIKSAIFIVFLFITGCYVLLFGMFDIGIIWFIMAVIYTLFVRTKKEAIAVFSLSVFILLLSGILIEKQITFLPVYYDSKNCITICIIDRIFLFLFVGTLIYYILTIFFSAIKYNIQQLNNKAENLEILNNALNKEMHEKRMIQQEMLNAEIMTEEKERKRIASDLHDGLGPVLSAINLYFQAYVDADKKDKKSISKKLQNIINNAISEVSRISHNISPAIIEKYGLIAALDDFINQINASKKITIDFKHDKIKRFGLKKELTIYRAITELINNTIKHANADLIKVKIEKIKDCIDVIYCDNGKGFGIDARKSGMGIMSIKNRISSINGKVNIASDSGNGMNATIKIPVFT